VPEAEGTDQPIAGVVSTIAAKCRRCYNCVRSCPAKAIRVLSGQAQVLAERCIGCGNCLKVCGQDAKQVQSAVSTVQGMLACSPEEAPVAAILAPSYPAAFHDDIAAGQIIAALKALGFARVMEVGFGAELVGARYAELITHPPEHPLISTPCPALVNYIEKYMPDLTPYLAPVVSPMIALARAIKQRFMPGARVVFIGPCVAKKLEIMDAAVAGDVEAVLTFLELSQLLQEAGIEPAALAPVEADGPWPHYGGLFPLSGGLLKTAALQADIMDSSILVVEGPDRCLEVLRELQAGHFSARFLDMLFCEGCIGGPAFANNLSPWARRERVIAHVRRRQAQAPPPQTVLQQLRTVDLRRAFLTPPIPVKLPSETELRDILARTEKYAPEDELNCGACGYPTCRDKAIAVYQGLAEPEMCLPYLIDQLQVNLEKLERSKEQIEKAREQAARAQELAAMGQLAADIANEISAPLSQVVVYAQLLRDRMPADDPRREDLGLIIHEAMHAREVLNELRGFARQKQPQWQETDLRQVVQNALGEIQPRLADTQIAIQVDIAPEIKPFVADPDLLQQVLVHLLTNSVEAMPEGRGKIEISARPAAEQGWLELVVRDNGSGIPEELLPHLMQPFVTTKHERRGAGLGLAFAHGVVRTHGGEIHIESRVGEGTSVIVRLPSGAPRALDAEEAIKVLLVDDDPDLLEVHRLRLAALGFNVLTAERSDEALEIADREIPDAFVLDLMMEKMDSGARLARALRRDPRFRLAPIILLTSVTELTGFDFKRNPREVMNWMKIDAWFDKPAPIPELASTIRQLLAQRQSAKA